MNGGLTANAALMQSLASAMTSSSTVVLCVPFPYLQQAKELLGGSQVAWGAQDVSIHPKGAFTGEVLFLVEHAVDHLKPEAGHANAVTVRERQRDPRRGVLVNRADLIRQQRL